MLAHITVANLMQTFTVLVLVAGLWRLTRGGTGAAVQELTAANKVLEKRNHELGGEVRDLRIRVAELSTRTDFASVMAEHERNAAQRTDSILAVLDLIAKRLGPEPGTGPAAKAAA